MHIQAQTRTHARLTCEMQKLIQVWLKNSTHLVNGTLAENKIPKRPLKCKACTSEGRCRTTSALTKGHNSTGNHKHPKMEIKRMSSQCFTTACFFSCFSFFLSFLFLFFYNGQERFFKPNKMFSEGLSSSKS